MPITVHKGHNTIKIRSLRESDYPDVYEIFHKGIQTGNATFETVPPNWGQWDARFSQKCRLVAIADNRVVGWAVLSSVSSRKVYSGVMEDTVYVCPDYLGMGIGKALLSELIRQAESSGIWTLQAVMFPENRASVQLHKSLGFREVGIRERIGQQNGTWRNTLLMERRSTAIK